MKEYRRFVAYVYEYQKEKREETADLFRWKQKNRTAEWRFIFFVRGCFRSRSVKFLDLSVTAD